MGQPHSFVHQKLFRGSILPAPLSIHPQYVLSSHQLRHHMIEGRVRITDGNKVMLESKFVALNCFPFFRTV